MTDSAMITRGDQIIALLRADEDLYATLATECDFGGRQLINFKDDEELFSEWEQKKHNIVAIISKSDILGRYGVNLIESLNKRHFNEMPVLLIGKHIDKNLRKIALDAGITDFFARPIKVKNIENRVNFLIDHWV
jgi:response regulator RpfG family c-di-GMP phosphodiesterase